jgi:glycosyltransferase involved in cell wall biosynthesis
LNILLVADVSIASIIGGAERVLYEESTRLARRGHSVSVLTRKLPYHESDLENINGVEEHRYSFQEKLFPFFFKSIFSDCRKTFRSLEENLSVDIINFHQPFSGAGVLSSTSSRKLPSVYTCHSLSFEEYISRSSSPRNPIKWLLHHLQVSARKSIEKTVLNRSDQIVALSEYTRKKLERTYNLLPSKVSVIPGGVDLERFQPSTNKIGIRTDLNLPQESNILFTVRNLVPRMGLANLISAFKTVLSERRDLFLVIGGEGPLAPVLRRQVEEYGIADFVYFAGYIPDNQLPSYYQMADLFILPTKELEGFGMVTVEALSSGLPVLGTPVGGTKEILAHLGPEFLFADSNPVAVADLILKTIKRWDEDPNGYKDISQKCRRIVERFYSWEDHIDQLEDLFCRLAYSASDSGRGERKLRHP